MPNAIEGYTTISMIEHVSITIQLVQRLIAPREWGLTDRGRNWQCMRYTVLTPCFEDVDQRYVYNEE